MNPFHRRGMLGALALIGMGGKAAASATRGFPIAGTVGEVLYKSRPEMADCSEGPANFDRAESERRFNLYHALQRNARRAARRDEIQRAFLDGWPAGLDSMHSNARWFRAGIAARRMEAIEDSRRSWEETLFDRIINQGLSG